MAYDKLIASLQPKPKVKKIRNGNRTFYMPEQDWVEFVALCEKLGIPRSGVIRGLLRDFMTKTGDGK